MKSKTKLRWWLNLRVAAGYHEPLCAKMNNKQRINNCNKALEANKFYLSESVYKEINSLINDHNEWGIGIEMLIDMLYEENIKIEIEQYKAIYEAMECMGLEKSDRIHLIKRQIKST